MLCYPKELVSFQLYSKAVELSVQQSPPCRVERKTIFESLNIFPKLPQGLCSSHHIKYFRIHSKDISCKYFVTSVFRAKDSILKTLAVTFNYFTCFSIFVERSERSFHRNIFLSLAALKYYIDMLKRTHPNVLKHSACRLIHRTSFVDLLSS